jgi:hypothetical protein
MTLVTLRTSITTIEGRSILIIIIKCLKGAGEPIITQWVEVVVIIITLIITILAPISLRMLYLEIITQGFKIK